jgi:hypothetical protein
MRFSIRDLLLVTVIVALAVGWWVDRATRRELETRTSDEIKRAEKDHWQVMHSEKQLIIARDGLEAQQRTIDYLESRVPNSSAPAPNPPKP